MSKEELNKKVDRDNNQEPLKDEISIDKEDSENEDELKQNENFIKGKEDINSDTKKDKEKSEFTHFFKN